MFTIPIQNYLKKLLKSKTSTRKTQILKVDHHSENDVTIAEDRESALPNADKNNKTIKINHKNIENQINHFIST